MKKIRLLGVATIGQKSVGVFSVLTVRETEYQLRLSSEPASVTTLSSEESSTTVRLLLQQQPEVGRRAE